MRVIYVNQHADNGLANVEANTSTSTHTFRCERYCFAISVNARENSCLLRSALNILVSGRYLFSALAIACTFCAAILQPRYTASNTSGL